MKNTKCHECVYYHGDAYTSCVCSDCDGHEYFREKIHYRNYLDNTTKSKFDSVITNLKRDFEKAVNNEPSVEITNVIFNPPATIVFWSDGTKTVVKAHDEYFDPEKGLAMAIAKKAFGNKGNYFNEIKKWTDTLPLNITVNHDGIELSNVVSKVYDGNYNYTDGTERIASNKEVVNKNAIDNALGVSKLAHDMIETLNNKNKKDPK